MTHNGLCMARGASSVRVCQLSTKILEFVNACFTDMSALCAIHFVVPSCFLFSFSSLSQVSRVVLFTVICSGNTLLLSSRAWGIFNNFFREEAHSFASLALCSSFWRLANVCDCVSATYLYSIAWQKVSSKYCEPT